jgi:hypothetical protein
MTNTYQTAEQWEAHASDYEIALRERPDDIEVWMNLTTLYWQAIDPGIAAGSGFSGGFFTLSADRLSALLADGRERFAGRAAAEFWTRFIEWAEYGRPLEVAECREWLAREPQFKDPALFGFMTTSDALFDKDIAQLLTECRGKETVRAAYLISVIESGMRRKRQLTKPSS